MGNSSSSNNGGNKNNRKCRSLPNSPDVKRQIPVPYSKTNGGTAIPLPATVLVQRRCPPDKIRPLPPTPNHVPCTGKNVPNGGESINISPSNNISPNQKSSNSNGLRQPQCKIPSSPYAIPSQTTSTTITATTTNSSNSVQNSSNQQQNVPPPLPASNPTTQSQTTTATKHSMLEKLKLFKSDKSSSNSTSSSTKSQVSKRTSSSSGFSSARSERSDSSLSLNDSNNHGTLLQNQQQQQLPPPTHLKPPNIIATTIPTTVSPQNATASSTATSSSRTKDSSTKKQSKLFSSSNGGGNSSSSSSGQKNKDLLSAGSSTKQKDNNKQKEKSPARHNSTKDDISDSKLISSSSGNSKSQKLSSKLNITEQQKLKSSSKLSLNSTKSSDSKTSNTNVQQQQQQNLKLQQQSGLMTITNPNGTGIPKPMAAVKGTSKTVQITIEKSSHHQQQQQQQQQLQQQQQQQHHHLQLQQLHSKPNLDLEHVKSEKQDISLLRNAYNDPSISVAATNHLDNTKTNIVNPLNIENNLIIGSATTTTTSANVAGISLTNGPILYNKILQQQQINNISMSDSLNSTSTTNSGGLHSNSSESSVIYRPGSESETSEYLTNNNSNNSSSCRNGTTSGTSGSNINNMTTKQQMNFSNKKFDQFLQLQQQQQQNSIISRKSNQQLQFQNRLQTQQHQKFNTVPSKMGPNSIIGNCGIITTTRDVIASNIVGNNGITGNNSQLIAGTIYEEDKHNLSIIPMRPLLRGYNSHVTLPTRGTRSGQHFINEFYDSDIGGTGYMSDGDSLRRHHHNQQTHSNQSASSSRTGTTTIRYSDIDNGYLSEGSIGIVHNQNHHNHQHHNQHHHHQHQSHSSKHFLNIMRGRQLPTTIEERVRGSRGSLESIITAPASINLTTSLNAQQQQQQPNNLNCNLSGNSSNINLKNNTNDNCSNNTDNNSIIKMDINGVTVNNSGNYIGSTAGTDNNCQQQQQLHENSISNRSSSRTTQINSNQQNGRDNWHKMPEPNPTNTTTNVIQQQLLHQQGLNATVTSSPNPNRKDKSSPNRRGLSSSSSSSSSKQSSSGRTKGVPQSFGYVKRTNGSATGTITSTDQQGMLLLQQQQQQHQQQQQQQQHHSSRTAHVSAVPRSGKIKVSGGTQTCQNDLQTKIPPNVQHRSFSLTGPGATQLSQSIRERLSNGSHSLPKPGSDMHMFQHRIANRNSNKILDGSLSDTQTYAEVKPEYSTYAMWLKHSNTTASRLSEGDSIESLQHIMGSPGMQRHSAHKLMQRTLTNTSGNSSSNGGSGSNVNCNNTPNTINSNTISSNGGTTIESTYVQSPRMNRSNSIRSTKSEKMYPSMLSRGSDVEIEPYYCLPVGSIHGQNGMPPGTGPGGSVVGIIPWSQPTSPTPPHNRNALITSAGTLSPTQTHSSTGLQSNSNGSSSIGGHNNLSSCHRLTYPKKNDEVHGSSASLLSGGSSLYGSAEERQANEVRRLKRELTEAREQVMSLSSQLSTNVSILFLYFVKNL
ncbi:protein sickie-like isoform X2 [Condylostylus longicornis]|uniref:protein sickie-like isoform X2 n=1 Tax=Condylostylus longicornis TaxID=2530218 RepID=UPI00244E2537|nr:protein sickie-like isoform X2 [Condylostylus longicornis]